MQSLKPSQKKRTESLCDVKDDKDDTYTLAFIPQYRCRKRQKHCATSIVDVNVAAILNSPLRVEAQAQRVDPFFRPG